MERAEQDYAKYLTVNESHGLGLDKNTAKILVVESSFESILELLPDKKAKEKVLEYVRYALGGIRVERL